MGLKWLSTAVSVLATFASSQASPPPSPIDPTTDRYGYTTVVDNYRWLEQADSARVKGLGAAAKLVCAIVLGSVA